MKHKADLTNFERERERDKLIIDDTFHPLINRALPSEIIITYNLFSFREVYWISGYQQNIYYYLLLSTIKLNFHAFLLEVASFSKKGSATYS